MPKCEVSILSRPIVRHLLGVAIYSRRFFPAGAAHLHAVRARVIPDNRSFFNEQRRLVSKTGVGLRAKGRDNNGSTFRLRHFDWSNLVIISQSDQSASKKTVSKMHESLTRQFSGIEARVLPSYFPVGSLLSVSNFYIAERGSLC